MTVEIDGSHGEGGGQILRTSLALSIITNQPLVMKNIRAGRAKPGLRRQHLTCVQAAAAMCNAELRGATVGSQHLEFTPNEPTTATELAFDIGTAGSTTLVVQTILIPAIVAKKSLRFTVEGGTHNPMAPPFDFLTRVFFPHLNAMGARVEGTLERYGFATGGGGDKRDFYDQETAQRGKLAIAIEPQFTEALAHLDLTTAGPITARHATALLARLPTHVGSRELDVVRERFDGFDCEVRDVPGGPANLLMLEIERGVDQHSASLRDAARPGKAGTCVRELVTVHGEKGLRAETVAQRACDELQAYLDADVPVGEHLADQLLLPMAIAGGGRFRCATPSLHATTNIDTIGRFLSVPISVEPDGATAVISIG
jgi:RNA 3'-terminal phosphate cyclase (ATP)